MEIACHPNKSKLTHSAPSISHIPLIQQCCSNIIAALKQLLTNRTLSSRTEIGNHKVKHAIPLADPQTTVPYSMNMSTAAVLCMAGQLTNGCSLHNNSGLQQFTAAQCCMIVLLTISAADVTCQLFLLLLVCGPDSFYLKLCAVCCILPQQAQGPAPPSSLPGSAQTCETAPHSAYACTLPQLHSVLWQACKPNLVRARGQSRCSSHCQKLLQTTVHLFCHRQAGMTLEFETL